MEVDTIATSTTLAEVHLAVIGGGAKAAALAAKADVLRQAQLADVRLTVFERSEVGANWTGKSGYTDGVQRLCTPAERDVGFPYRSGFGKEVDSLLYAQYSWASYVHTQPPGYELGYSTWVDAGRKPPLHKHFAEYLQWVVKKAGVTVIKGSVEGLKPVDRQWVIQHRNDAGKLVPGSAQLFDGVVVCGPGPARSISRKTETARVFDGIDFWQRLPEVKRLIRKFGKELEITLVGAGGTAAAALAWLVTNGCRDNQIVMVADQAALFTRVDSVFENRLFSDEIAWAGLSSTSRDAFFKRLNRGVVWSTVMDQVSSATRVAVQDGRAKAIRTLPRDAIELTVTREGRKAVKVRSDLLVDASGFNPWWFLGLIRGISAERRKDRHFQARLEQSMGSELQLKGADWPYPLLHAPFVSSALGPGYGSLMVLGALSDRVLRAHVTTGTQP